MASKPNNQNADADIAEKLKASEEALAKARDEAKAEAGRAAQLASKLEAAEARIARLETDLREKTLPTIAPEKTGGVRVAARPAGGFRRGGIHHSSEPVDYPAGHFTEDQIKAMKAESNLSVIDI